MAPCFKTIKPNALFITLMNDLLGKVMLGWANPSSDAILCPSAVCKDKLIFHGANSGKIELIKPLIPEKCKQPLTIKLKEKYLEDMGFNPKNPMILMLSNGRPYYADMINSLANQSVNICLISNGSKDLENKIKELKLKNPNVKIFPKSNDIVHYIRLCDCVIANPDAAVVSLLLSAHKPFIIDQMSKLTPHEEQTCEYIIAHGYGLRLRSPDELSQYCKEIFENNLIEFSQRVEDERLVCYPEVMESVSMQLIFKEKAA
jgi:UDP-N-acetylglucosamine:LPS N-acetylglucosamine transferase